MDEWRNEAWEDGGRGPTDGEEEPGEVIVGMNDV